jgi:hypothetical protein
LRKTEVFLQEENRQQLELAREQMEKQLSSEFDEKLAAEKQSMNNELVKLEKELEETYRIKQNTLRIETEKHIQEQLEILRKIEEEKSEQKK